jgi:hypothetical protein
MSLSVTLTYEDDTANPVATKTAMNINAVDTDDLTRYYLSAEKTGEDTAKSPVFAGDYTWLGWIAPSAGEWTFHLRAEEDDNSAANVVKTFDAA